MKIVRNYTHRTYGEIGSVTLDAEVTTASLDGKPLNANVVEYLLNFALQSLQDAYAGAKNATEAVAAFEKKRQALMDNTIGTRGGGEGVSEETKVQRMIVRNAVKAKFGAKSPEWAKFTGLDDAEQEAKLDAWFAANAESFAPHVKAEMKRREDARKAKAKLADGVSFEL